ncbi:hypothetical protein [Flectobacillus roseus]|uniref:Uncharacterized protein n=1 Tax=Flectobacillus roseus TaxID=502259 RepID=A0ABT6Y319_9BACT|nr:hypothetical protein [Flectobacillus roseus]MDI9857959.1 hypothetical protein [Flectobacillus roseus]
MGKYFFYVSVLFLITFGANAQTQMDTILSELSLLKKKTSLLEAGNLEFRRDIRKSDSIKYSSIRNQIFEAYTKSKDLDFDFKQVSDKIVITGLLTKLMDANNPVSDILGFKFTEVVVKASEKHLLSELPKEEKPRFWSIVNKIIENPIVSSILKSNPLTTTVSSVVNSIANFTSTKVITTNSDGKVKTIKDLVADTKDVFDQKKISLFKDELQPYIDFYDEMILSSERYLQGLNELNKKYSYLNKNTKTFNKDLIDNLGIKNQVNPLIELTTILPQANIDTKYQDLVNLETIQNGLEVAKKLPVIQQSVNDFKKDYNTLLSDFLSSYVRIFQKAKSFPKSSIDNRKIDGLIAEVEAFKLTLQVNKEIDAFK